MILMPSSYDHLPRTPTTPERGDSLSLFSPYCYPLSSLGTSPPYGMINSSLPLHGCLIPCFRGLNSHIPHCRTLDCRRYFSATRVLALNATKTNSTEERLSCQDSNWPPSTLKWLFMCRLDHVWDPTRCRPFCYGPG